MYVTAANECVALDAGSGREIWQFKRPRTKGVGGGGANRGVAVAGDRVFMVTDHAHLLALNRFTGEVLWDSVMDDWRKNYSASSAPLTAGDLVVSGVSGGEHGANGFVVAFDQATGREVWRFWTVPKPGQPGSETWQRQGHRSRRRADVVHRQLRPRARHGVLADGQPEQGIQRRRPAGRQPVCELHPRARPHVRTAQVALSVHAARPVGLGRDADLGARRRRLEGRAAAADAARQPQRLLLRVRPSGRHAAAGAPVRQESDLGHRHRRRRPAR